MIALYIILGLLLVVTLLYFFLRIGFWFTFYGKELELVVTVGVVKLYFDMEDIIEEIKERLNILQEEDEEEEKRLASEGSEISTSKKTSIIEEKPIVDMLKVVKEGVVLFYKAFSRFARLDKYMLKINLGTDDPAKTAMMYAGVNAVAAALHSFALSIERRRHDCTVETEVTPDFIAEKSDIAVELGFTLRLWQYRYCSRLLTKTKKKLENLPSKKKKGDITDERQAAE